MFRSFQLLNIGFKKSNYKNYIFPVIRQQKFHEEFSSPVPLDKDDKQKNLPGTVRAKYKIFKDEESTIIYDVEEERQRVRYEKELEDNLLDSSLNINTERGVHGVFDIEDLVDVLRKENAIDIFVCSVPKELKYIDYMCVVTGRSFRHMSAIAEFVRKIYKLKRYENDVIPKIEGENSKDWMALDLGNIALHIFSEDARKIYDLESLWSIGPEYDAECNKPQDPLIELFEKNSIYLSDFKPKEIHDNK